MSLEEKLNNLPAKSGVYIFRDDFGRAIYVGKASNLRNRVRQYFQAPDSMESPRRSWLRRSIRDLDFTVVNSPVEALILEANLIKRYRPYFNVTLKDDKRYPCIEITVYEKYPRMRIIRKPTNKKSRYFGPYTRSQSMRRIFKLVQKIFKVRTCKYDLNKKLDRPCLDYHINLCPAPCTRYISKRDYRDNVDRACRFLDGQTGDVIKWYREQLEQCSQNMEYERCAFIRDVLNSLEISTSPLPVVTKVGDNADFIGIAREDRIAVAALERLRDGKVIDVVNYPMNPVKGVDDSQLIYRFIQQNYSPGFFIPPVIYVPILPDNCDDLKNKLSQIRRRKVEIKVPKRGQRKKLLDIARDNASEYVKMESLAFRQKLEKNRQALEEIRDMLSLPEIPSRIEGYDVSNIGGKQASASMVVFLDGEPYKRHYRRFKIRHQDTPDDYAMLKQALTRRFKNLKVGEMESFRQQPDLILVDGGKGQLGAAIEAAQNLDYQNIPIVSLAKKEEQLFVPGWKNPINTTAVSPGMNLLKGIRDEAHRFAISHHRTMRSKRMKVSILDRIPGIAKARKETLLRNFDSIEEIANASLYELEQLPGFNRKVAENVLLHLEGMH